MKITQKAGVLCISLVLLFSACRTIEPIPNTGFQQNNISAADQSTSNNIAEQEMVEVMLPSSHQNLGQLLQEIADSQNIHLEIRLAGNEPRYTLELMEAMESDNQPDIYWLAGEFSARVLDESSYYPFNFAVPASGLMLESLASMVPNDFRLLDEEKIYAFPVGAYAQGTLVNLPLLAALLGTEDLVALQRDLILCTYEEWQVMQQAIADYLVTPGRYQFSLGTGLYTMPSYRPQQAETLRGLWALATVGETDYGKNSLETSFAAAYIDPSDYLDSDPSILNELMQQPLEALYAEIEFETQNMVGHDGSLSRGEGFSLAREITAEEAQEFFENGSALFWKTDSQMAMQIERENSDLTQNLFLIPTKMPFSDANIAAVNQMYCLIIDGYLAVAGPEEAGGAAGRLLAQLFTEESSLQAMQTELNLLPFTEFYPQSNVLRALEESVGIGEYYLMPVPTASMLSTRQSMGDWINLNLMDSSEWTEEDKEDFLTAMQGMWGELELETPEEDTAIE